MQILSLKQATALDLNSEPDTLAEAAYIGWKKLDPNNTKIYPVIPDLKLNPAAQYDIAKLLASGISAQHMLNSPWGRTEKGREILQSYIDNPESSPIKQAMRNFTQSITKSNAAIYYAEQLKVACAKPLTTKDIETLSGLIEEIKEILSKSPTKIKMENLF